MDKSNTIHLKTLHQKGNEIFGSDKFKIWLEMENKALNNKKPISFLDTIEGIQMVRDVIGRIEHGVYS